MKSFAVLLAVALYCQANLVASQEDPIEDKGVASGEAPASDQPSSGEQFVAFHRDGAVGAKEELSPTLLGVNNMAMKFLPGNLRLLTVISVNREIVAGVKYELVVNALQESNGERIVCDLVVLEKPWIVNQWGEKWRTLLHSNCTVEGVEVEQPPNGVPTETFQVNPVFNRPQTVALTEDRIRELEEQILRGNQRRVDNINFNKGTSVPLEPMPTETPPQSPVAPLYPSLDGLSGGVRDELDKFFHAQQLAVQQQQQPLEEQNQSPVDAGGAIVVQTTNPVQSVPEPTLINGPTESVVVVGSTDDLSTVPYSTTKNGQLPEMLPTPISNTGDDQDNVQQRTVPVFENDQDNVQQRIVPVFETVTPEIKNNNNNEDANNQQKDRRRRSSHDLISQGFLEIGLMKRSVIGRNGDEKEDVLAETLRDCADKPFQHRKPVGCPDSTRVKRGDPGGLSDLSTEDPKVQNIVKVALVKLASSSSDASSLELVSIEKAQSQVVAGKMYHIDVVLKNCDEEPKKCLLKVWYQLWVSKDPIEVNGLCEDKTTYQHKRVVRSVSDEEKEPIVGGPTKIEDPENDLTVQSYLSDALASYNSGKYGNGHMIHKIMSATVQLVAGTLHKIHVQLRNAEETKNCLVKVWNRSWLENGKETTITCEGEKEIKSRSRRSLKYDHRPLPDHVRSSRDGDAADEEELHQHLFRKFQTKFQRNYRTEREKTMRYKVFKTNLATIEQLNRHEMGTAKYGLTEFSDLTAAEFKKHTGLLNAHHNPRLHANHLGNPQAEIPDVEVPKSFDWRDKNVISPVKNQGQCGSCWAFSVVGNIEGLNAIKTGKLDEFSEQELVDCDTLDAGCNGGLPDNAYKAIEQIGGLEYENEYPYEAKQEKCHFNGTLSHVRVKGAVDLPKDEQAMAQWLVANGPISIGLNAAAMQFYHGGVSHPYRVLCRASKIDHGVLIVGLGVSEYPTLNKTLPYWIVKNSWGPSWGERGYYRIYRGDNTCGINSMASSAVLE